MPGFCLKIYSFSANAKKIVSTRKRDLSFFVTFLVTGIHKGEYTEAEIEFVASGALGTKFFEALGVKPNN
jgi:hypothetical protein